MKTKLLDTPAPLEADADDARPAPEPVVQKLGTTVERTEESAPMQSTTKADGDAIVLVRAPTETEDAFQARLRSQASSNTPVEPAEPPPRKPIRLVADPVQRPRLVDEIKRDVGELIGLHVTIGGAAKKAREVLGATYIFTNGAGHEVDAPEWLVNDLALSAGKVKVQRDEPPPRRTRR